MYMPLLIEFFSILADVVLTAKESKAAETKHAVQSQRWGSMFFNLKKEKSA